MMVLGAVYCSKEEAVLVNKRIRELKVRHNLSSKYEMKWVKISKMKIQFYLDVIDYFFDNDDLHFRGVVINKKELDHKKFKQSHDEWYYKMYFTLLSTILSPNEKYAIYIDIKDTNGTKKIAKLREVLCNSMYDFGGNIIKNVQQIRSHEVECIQLTDLIIGALQFKNREDVKSVSKLEIVSRIQNRSGYDLSKSTLLKEEKVNLFYWKGNKSSYDI